MSCRGLFAAVSGAAPEAAPAAASEAASATAPSALRASTGYAACHVCACNLHANHAWLGPACNPHANHDCSDPACNLHASNDWLEPPGLKHTSGMLRIKCHMGVSDTYGRACQGMTGKGSLLHAT